MLKKCSLENCYKKYYAKGYCESHYANIRKHGKPEAPSRIKKIEFEVNSKGCFICTSHTKNKDGYPLIQHKKRTRFGHRVIYTEMFGEIPKGLVIRHKCDEPSCINPEHLQIGTQTQNIQDAVLRNRMAKGSKRPNSLLDEEKVSDIKRRLKNKEKGREIAEVFGVHERIISDIKTERTWKHVPFPKEESK